MKKAIEHSRVSGFLHTAGTELRNGREERVLLLGWGLGNWLLCEGYMWGFDGHPQFDRPRRIEQTIRTLTGEKYAERFWANFRNQYITEADIALMAEMGCNSLRVPIASRLFLEEGPKARFLEEGFLLLDRLLDWCEKYDLYAFIDLHAAPGGQTGANIDDSTDDLCRLFIDDAQFECGLALWDEIARRYRDRWIVGGSDLLNEPIRPPRFPGDTDLDVYIPRLKDFYEQAIERIRRHDQRFDRQHFHQSDRAVRVVGVQMRQHQQIHLSAAAAVQILPRNRAGVVQRIGIAAVDHGRPVARKRRDALSLSDVQHTEHVMGTIKAIRPQEDEQQGRERERRRQKHAQTLSPAQQKAKSKQRIAEKDPRRSAFGFHIQHRERQRGNKAGTPQDIPCKQAAYPYEHRPDQGKRGERAGDPREAKAKAHRP